MLVKKCPGIAATGEGEFWLPTPVLAEERIYRSVRRTSERLADALVSPLP